LYDIAVIGAGINGATTAYMLHQLGKNVVIFDQKEVAGGGSGAAGAFLSPKFVKNGELKTLINTALDEAFEFYPKISKEHFHRYPLLHIAKDDKDARNLLHVKQHDHIELLYDPPFIPKNEYIYTSKSAIIDAKKMCKTLLNGVEIRFEKVNTLYHDDRWIINGHIEAKKVVLATGAYKHLIDEAYLQNTIRGIWGHRIDIETTTNNPVSIHQYVSISPSINGVLSIGATHDVHFHPENGIDYDYEKGREELLDKAQRTLTLENIKIIKDYVGLRSGSSDYMPLLGKIVNTDQTLQQLSRRALESKKQDYSQYRYYNDLYMINGSAGYGFVLAPYLAKKLVGLLIYEEKVPKALEVARFFIRYARRNR